MNNMVKMIVQYLYFESLVGQILTKAKLSKDKTRLTFKTLLGLPLIMMHEQECCESVWLEDINGDLEDLLNSPITVAECVTNRTGDDRREGETWTFYKIGTVKGTVTLRWYGTSNGYYSEKAEFGIMGKY